MELAVLLDKNMACSYKVITNLKSYVTIGNYLEMTWFLTFFVLYETLNIILGIEMFFFVVKEGIR